MLHERSAVKNSFSTYVWSKVDSCFCEFLHHSIKNPNQFYLRWIKNEKIIILLIQLNFVITFVLHLEHICLEHRSHLLPLLKKPNLVFIQRKQTFPFSTSSFSVPSSGKLSNSAFVNTVRMCTTSSRVKSNV